MHYFFDKVLPYLLDKVFPTLAGTLVGAWLAFTVKRKQDQHEEQKKKTEAANYALFVLVQQTNDLLQVEKAISEWRPENKRDTRWIEMKAVLGFSELLQLRAEDLGWLLTTEDRNLLGRYMACRNGYLTVMGLLEHRKKIKGNVDDHLERAIVEANLELKPDSSIPESFIAKTLSPRQVLELTQSAENLLEFNLSILIDHLDVIELLHASFKKTWPKKIFIKLGAKEEVLSQVGIVLSEPLSSSSENAGLRVYRFEVN